MSKLLALLKLFNPTSWAIGGALLLALWLGFQAFVHYERGIGHAQAVAEYAAQAAAADAKRAAVAAPIAEQHQAAVERIRTVTQTIIKEVPVYVKNTDCPSGLSGGVRVFHDAAANGEVPDATRIADAARVEVADLANTVAANYGACLENARRLTDLQKWITEQQALK